MHLSTNSSWNFCNKKDNYHKTKRTFGQVYWYLLCNYMLQYYIKLDLNNIDFSNIFFPHFLTLISIIKTHTSPFFSIFYKHREDSTIREGQTDF